MAKDLRTALVALVVAGGALGASACGDDEIVEVPAAPPTATATATPTEPPTTAGGLPEETPTPPPPAPAEEEEEPVPPTYEPLASRETIEAVAGGRGVRRAFELVAAKEMRTSGMSGDEVRCALVELEKTVSDEQIQQAAAARSFEELLAAGEEAAERCAG